MRAVVYLGTRVLCLAFALLTFFQFPGHTWLQQDTQIYAPILEHLRDPAVLRDRVKKVVSQPDVALEYVSVADPYTLEELRGPAGQVVISVAARVGKARLIDNVLLGLDVGELE